MNLSRTFLWRKLRECKILRTHRRVAGICENLISEHEASPVQFELAPKKQFPNDRIIWQYWAQGYENVPLVVRKCLDSVEKYAGNYTLVRLTDENLSDYLDLPEFVKEKRACYSMTHFSDLLRLMLLRTYGGIWADATIMLSAPIPEDYAGCDFFVFRRDPNEPNRKYWCNTYAYYFGWAKGFRVNMLNSFIVARRGNRTVGDLCDLMLLWWQKHDSLPDFQRSLQGLITYQQYRQFIVSLIQMPERKTPVGTAYRIDARRLQKEHGRRKRFVSAEHAALQASAGTLGRGLNAHQA